MKLQRIRPSFATRLAYCSLLAVALSACKGGTNGVGSTSLDPPAEPDPPGEVPAFPFVEHVAQADITSGSIAFDELFVLGDELFEVQFTSLDGSGALRLPDGSELPSRFSRVPPGGGRFTGPNAQACGACHNSPFPTSAGEAANNVVQDPAGLGLPPFNRRNTISLFGSGIVQRLAEEITDDLLEIRAAAAAASVAGGSAVTRELVSKDLSFGSITATRSLDGSVTFDTSAVEGIDADLVVRAFGWKGDVASLRGFVRGAASNEIGMEPDELVAKHPLGLTDPDGDGVEGELSIGDITALTIYCAAQEIPTSTDELAAQGLGPSPTAEVAVAVARGRQLFEQIGCNTCHVPEIVLDDTVFEEPTLRGAGQFADLEIDAESTSLDPMQAFEFDFTQEGDLPRLQRETSGQTVARVFGDFKRHRMGRRLADGQATPAKDSNGDDLEIDGTRVLIDTMTFMTPELWGVGNTGPWLHDGRAASLAEAIEAHGEDSPPDVGDAERSEAQESRDAFLDLSEDDQNALVEFLESLVLFAFVEE